MSEEKGFWRHPIVVTIIGTLAVPVLGTIAHYAGITPQSAITWLTNVAKFWTADVALPRWSFWLWVLVTLALFLLVGLRLYFFFTEEQSHDVPQQQPQRQIVARTFQSYVTDVFFGWRWRWKTTANGEVWDIGMYCPKCDQELMPSDFEAYRYGEYHCTCSHCSYRVITDGDSPGAMHNKVKLAAERKIRTGEWEKASKQIKISAR